MLYPLSMGLALIATGEHYFFDVLLGWLYAAAVMGGWAWWERRRSVAQAVLARVPLTEPGLPRTGRA
jgi:membrane-associated phospholipid phosphatase